MLPQAMSPPLYPPEMTIPMERELSNVGVTPLKTSEAVDTAIKQDDLVVIVVNSVCGCAAGNARPAIIEAINRLPLAAKWYTFFAGVDREAVDRARALFVGIYPSSPSIFFLKNGKVVFSISRNQIEGRTPASIAADLVRAMREHTIDISSMTK